MSTTSGTSAPTASNSAGKALAIGFFGLVLTAFGFLFMPAKNVALSYLVGVIYWTATAIGMLMLVMIHHIFDAGWSVVPRRQLEHGLTAFKWLFVLFVPLLVSVFVKPGLIWPWMNPAHKLHESLTVGNDILYVKKSSFLNVRMFVGLTVVFYGIWIFLSYLLRSASFAQDKDGSFKWTIRCRKIAAAGIPLTALSLTGGAIFWMKSLEYHWFSTMYGVWFFANCMRGALCVLMFILIWSWHRGDLRGALNTNHWHCIGTLTHAFSIFWAYVTFSQYFLIWNANVPEETFWYNLREINNSNGEPNQWKWVGFVILFGHFFFPFLYLLSYRLKSTWTGLLPICISIGLTTLIDLCYNVLPTIKDAHGDPLPFFSLNLLWVTSSLVGTGGIFFWAFLCSYASGAAKLIPIRDPRIKESLSFHPAATNS